MVLAMASERVESLGVFERIKMDDKNENYVMDAVSLDVKEEKLYGSRVVLRVDRCSPNIVDHDRLSRVKSDGVKKHENVARLKASNFNCFVSVVDLFLRTPIDSFECLGCHRFYCSQDSLSFDLATKIMSVVCSRCRWWTQRAFAVS